MPDASPKESRSLSSLVLRGRWLALGIAALALALYLNALPNGFVFDDWQQIVENPFLRRSDALRQIFSTGVWQFLGSIGVSNFYRPLMHACFYAVYRMFGPDPAAYHAVSLLLHATVSLAAYAVIARLGRDRLVAAAAALLFAAHPVHVEAVAWISAYPELLCALFSLLAIWLYLRAEAARGSLRLALLLLTGPVLLLGLLSKEIAIAVPPLLVCYELTRHRTSPRSQAPSPKPKSAGGLGLGTWDLGLPAWVSMAAAIAVYLAARVHALGALMPASSNPAWRDGEHLWTAIAVLYRCLAVQLWPVRLHAFYYLDRSRSPLEAPVLGGLLAGAATVLLAWWLWRRRRPEVLAVPLYLFALAPAFLLPYASVGLLMAERYAYLASLGFCWLLAAGLVASGRRWSRRAGRPALAVFLIVLAGYSARTVLRNADWRDEIAFYRRTITDFPGFPRAYLNLGEALMRRGRWDEARQATEAAVRLDAGYAEPHVNLGLIYRATGDSDAAARELTEAARLGEQQGKRFVVSRALADLAVVYRGMGRLDDSVAASRRALAADPQFAGAHNNLGYALLLAGRTEEAVWHLQAAVELDPTLDVAWSNLGLAAAMDRQWTAARAYLRRAEQLNPGGGEIQARLGEVYLAQGAVQVARRHFARALLLEPGNKRALAALESLKAMPREAR